MGAAPAVADDLSQEAFVKWLNHSHWVDEPEQARAFLFTTATRLLISHWRRERRLVSWDQAVPVQSVEPAGDGLLSGEAWAGLSRRERQLLWLAYAEEFSHAEMAGITDLAPASIKVLLSRARARLKASLTPRETPDE
jgi:RNA polymerase sigma-70 factor (ECF subfamily)